MNVTLHTLLRDIPNPLAQFTDKRKDNGWLDLPEIAKHQRFLIVKSFPEKRRADDGSTWRSVHIAKAVFRDDANPPEESSVRLDAWYEVVTVKGAVEINFRGDLQAESCREYGHSRRDLKHAEAHAELSKALAANLSAPIIDYRTAFLDTDTRPASTPADILHRLYLLGIITLSTIEDLHATMHAERAAKNRVDKPSR